MLNTVHANVRHILQLHKAFFKVNKKLYFRMSIYQVHA